MTNNVPNLTDIAENLAELLTNSVNIVDKYYDMFFNETPMLVELDQYNSEGVLITHHVPNLAKIIGDLPNEFANKDLSNLSSEGNSRTVPTAEDQEGKFLSNDGFVPEWNDNVANKDLSNLSNAGNAKLIPDMTGMNGKLLTTDGVEASWSTYNMPKKVSDLINDLGFVTTSVRDLEYYTKTEDLNAYMADKINQSKGLLTGNISMDSDVLDDVREYSHNNYDASKFTTYLIGSSIAVTDEGIVSNLISGNKVKVSGLPLQDAGSATFEFEYTWNGDIVSSDGYVAKIANEAGTSSVDARITTTTGQVIFSTTYSGSTNDNFITCQLISGMLTRFIVKITPTTTTISWYIGDAMQNRISRNTSLTLSNDFYLGVGNMSGQALSKSTTDLKRIRILKDDYEIFNGNKTGVDIIKADDYTVVGSPTISADGIASGLITRDSYIKSSAIMKQPTKSLEIHWKGTFDSNANTFVGFSFTGSNFALGQFNSNSIRNYSASGVFSTSMGGILSNGDSLEVLFRMTSTTKYCEVTTKYGVSTNSATGDYSSDFSSIVDNSVIWIGAASGGSYAWTGSIDLNAFKIYIDGNLVYQPCLKIPYVLSKTGCKVVDAFLRSRVQDTYDYKGVAGYYTLSELDFTLPMGEVYGMMDQMIENNVPSAVSQAMGSVLSDLYPVGALYIGTQSTCPLATLIPNSTWQKIEGAYLCATGTLTGGGTEDSIEVNTFKGPGLPQHYHAYSGTTASSSASHSHSYSVAQGGYRPYGAGNNWGYTGNGSGTTGSSDATHSHTYSGNTGNASNSTEYTTSVWGNSKTVRPPAYGVNVWRRTA